MQYCFIDIILCFLLAVVKAKVAPQKKGEAPKPVEKKTRDFSGDLEAYLNDWAAFQQDSGHPWKFNKILQEWAIQNCVEKPKVAASLFKLLLPYLATVQGGARQRMEERMRNLIENNGVEDGVSAEEEEKDRSRRVERAVKVLRALGTE